ncbi:MAG: AI-2E family transporter [Gemmatimonadota bacterium]
MPDPSGRGRLRLLVTAVAIVLALLFVYLASELLLLLFISILFAVYLSALTDWLQTKLGLPRPLGITASLLLTLVGFGGVGVLLIPNLTRQAADLIALLPDRIVSWETGLTRLAERYPLLSDMIGPLQEGQSYFGSIFGEIGQYFRDVFPYLFGGFWFLIHAVSAVAMAVYLTAKPAVYRSEIIQLVPPKSRDIALDILRELGTTLRAWIGGQLVAMTVLGLLTWLLLELLGVPFALAFGVFTGVVAIVPFFGTLVSTLLPALYVLPSGGLLYALVVVGVGVVVHLVEANVVAPKIFERQVELPPVWTLLSVLVALKLLGPIGLIVAVPILAVLRVLVRRLYVDRILESGGFHPTLSDEPVVIRVPADGGFALSPAGSARSVPDILEERSG